MVSKAIDLYRRARPVEESRYSFQNWIDDYMTFSFGGNTYGPYQVPQTMSGTHEPIEGNFAGLVQGAYKANGVVFACILARAALFSEARFQWQELKNGVAGNLFGTTDLARLERPEPGKTTRELLARAESDVSLAGNHFLAAMPNGELRRLRPDWVTIVSGSPEEYAGEVYDEAHWDLLGYIYQPGGKAYNTRQRSTVFFPEDVAHWSPIPDPVAPHRGISWLSPIVTNVEGHNAATQHKVKFFENGATPNMIIKYPEGTSLETFQAFREKFENSHRGALNAYKTLHLGAGADATVVGNSFEQMSFKTVQGTDETLICAAAGVPPVLVGVSEGLASATYSNYGMARRKFGDHWARPQWGSFAAALEVLFPPPSPVARLWYDDRGIAFLREDMKDEADIRYTQALTVGSLINAGYTPDSVTDAVTSGDFSRLVHTGLYSVLLQKPGAIPTAPSTAPTPA